MTDPTIDALALGQQVVAVLETGLRTATYKLATLMALVDDCVEYLPENPEDELAIPIRRLAGRVLETYWRQVAPLHGFGRLRQSSQPRARVLIAVQALRVRLRPVTSTAQSLPVNGWLQRTAGRLTILR